MKKTLHDKWLRGALATVLVIVVGAWSTGCRKEQPPPPPEAPEEPEVVAVDLGALAQIMEAPSEFEALYGALSALHEALATEGAIPPNEIGRARELHFEASFAALVMSAVAEAEFAPLPALMDLDEDLEGPVPALLAFGERLGDESTAAKAARLIEWMLAEPPARDLLDAPSPQDWDEHSGDDSSTGLAVRATALKLIDGLAATWPQKPEAERYEEAARLLQGLLCVNCGDLAEVAPEERADLLYAADNLGIVCPASADRIARHGPHMYRRAVAEGCKPSDFGLQDTPDGLAVLTGGNALVLRALAIAGQAMRTPATESPLGGLVAAKAAALEQSLGELLLPLALPWLPAPVRVLFPDEGDEPPETEAPSVVPPLHVKTGGVRRPAPPLEAAVITDNGVSLALRPLVAFRRGAVFLEDLAAGYAFPGEEIITYEGLAAADRERARRAREEEIEIGDPDVIEKLKEGLGALASRAATFTPRAFHGDELLGANSYADDEPLSALVAVHHTAPAFLLRRTLASMHAAGYRHPLLSRPATHDLAGDHVLPVVFRAPADLPDDLVAVTHERPILVVIEEDAVILHPPRGPKERLAPAGERPDWPEEAAPLRDYRRRFFAAKIELPEPSEPIGPAVAQAALRLRFEHDAGGLMYVTASPDAMAGRVVEILAALAHVGDEPLAPLSALSPGLECDEDCPTSLAVLFPEVAIPEKPEPPRERPAPPPPPGFCEEKDIAQVVGARRGSFQYCYESQLQQFPDIEGRVNIRFTVGTEGEVANVRVTQSTLNNRPVEECLLRVFRQMRFRPPRGGVCVVNWPLVFRR